MPCRANHQLVDVNVRRLGNDEINGIGDILAIEQWSEIRIEFLHQLIVVAGRILKSTDNNTRLDNRNPDTRIQWRNADLITSLICTWSFFARVLFERNSPFD